jgi:hypothetical protein
MADDRFMFTTFCDDVRQEAGGKLSYMGIYAANLLVPAYPAHLPKLCAVMTVRTSANRPPKSVVLKLLRDDEVIYEHAFDAKTLKQLVAAQPKKGVEHRHITLGAVAQISNVKISERCLLKARAVVDGEELRGGTLELRALESAE